MSDTIDISQIDTSFGDGNEPKDEYLMGLLKKAYSGEIDCHKAIIPFDYIVPFSDFKPATDTKYRQYFDTAFASINPPELFVYEKDGKFIMSDDYQAYYLYKEKESPIAICVVVGPYTLTENIQYGPAFKLEFPTVEMI